MVSGVPYVVGAPGPSGIPSLRPLADVLLQAKAVSQAGAGGSTSSISSSSGGGGSGGGGAPTNGGGSYHGVAFAAHPQDGTVRHGGPSVGSSSKEFAGLGLGQGVGLEPQSTGVDRILPPAPARPLLPPTPDRALATAIPGRPAGSSTGASAVPAVSQAGGPLATMSSPRAPVDSSSGSSGSSGVGGGGGGVLSGGGSGGAGPVPPLSGGGEPTSDLVPTPAPGPPPTVEAPSPEQQFEPAAGSGGSRYLEKIRYLRTTPEYNHVAPRPVWGSNKRAGSRGRGDAPRPSSPRRVVHAEDPETRYR
jgi:hypothetical protein